MAIRPTIRQLHYLCVLAQKGSFRAAAEACFVSQSTLSSGIKQLEDGLQSALVDRSSPSFRLTTTGEEVLQRAQLLLRDVDDLVASVQQNDRVLSGSFRLGIIPSIGPFLLPRALPSLRQAYPDLRLYLREALTRDLLTDLRAGRLDGAILALPYRLDDLAVQVFGRDYFQIAVPKGHDLCTRHMVGKQDLREETLILLEDGHCLRDHILARLKRGQNQGDDVHATSLITIVQMVANGLGVTLLPDLAVRAGLVAGLEVELLAMEGEEVDRELALVWRPHSALEQNCPPLADHLARFVGA
ncbi:MAG: LysR substrate-binding domain-containing protein [Cohaesibacter sp.]|nr:LysR substrate-binding domain-containing protein [Cohaesibacter sp.]